MVTKAQMPLFILLVLVIFLGIPVRAQGPGSGCAKRADDMIDKAALRGSSVVAALVDFGRSQGACFGIESPDVQMLRQPIDLEFGSLSIRSILFKILPSTPRYEVSEQHGIIMVRSRAELNRAGELDMVLPEYTLPADSRATLEMASIGLFNRLRMLQDPSIRGFAGDMHVLPSDEVIAPVIETEKTVRELLNIVVGRSNGASWMSGSCDPSELKTGVACWVIAQYSRPEAVDSVVREYVRVRLQKLDARAVSSQTEK